MKKLAIIILNYNGKKLLQKSLPGIIKYLGSQTDLILVDNGSTDEGGRFARSFANAQDDVYVIFNDSNLGFTGGNNVGIKYALKQGYEYIMLLNNDVLIKNNFWKLMIDYLDKDKNKKVGILGPKIYFAKGYEFHKDRYKKEDLGKVIWAAGGKIDWNNLYASNLGVDEVDTGQNKYNKICNTDFITGCCLLARSKVWERVGLFDDRYFLYLEDVDFCVRAQRVGWQAQYFPDVAIWHMNAGSSRSGGKLHDYFITRNRLLFGMKFAKLRTKFALIRQSFRILFTGRKWQKIGVRDFYLRRFGKGSWGK